MQNVKKGFVANILPWLFYIVVIISALAFTHHGQKIPANWGVNLFSTPSEIMNHFGAGDQSSYVHAAMQIRNEGLRAFARGGLAMFPPGLPTIEMLLIAISPDVPLAFVLLILTIALWAIFMVRLFHIVETCFHIDRRIAFFLPLLLIITPFWSIYIWETVLATESLSMPLFFIACIECLHMMLKPENATVKRSIVIGLLFAMASYIRAQFDFIFLLFSVVSLFIILIAKYRISMLDSQKKLMWRHYSVALLTVFLAYHVAVVPYKIIKKAGTIVVMEYAWEAVWIPAERHAPFLAGGGTHAICTLAPEQCAKFMDRKDKGEVIPRSEYKNTAMKTVLMNPLALFKFKMPYFWIHWMADQVTPYGTYFNAALLGVPFLMIGLLGIPSSRNKKKCIGIYFLYLIAMVGGSAGFSLIVHLEPRYFLPIKMFLYLSLLLGLTWAIANTKFLNFIKKSTKSDVYDSRAS